MATSSITENIRVYNPNLLEAYAEALDKAELGTVYEDEEAAFEEVTDPNELREIMLRGINKWGKKEQ